MAEYDLTVGPLGFTLAVDVPDKEDKKAVLSAEVIVDSGMVERDLLEEYEDEILAKAGRYLGRKVRWYEGDWDARDRDLFKRHISIGRR